MRKRIVFWKISYNCRSALLLLIPAKVSERITYNRIYKYLNGNNLISPNQSGYKSGDLIQIHLDKKLELLLFAHKIKKPIHPYSVLMIHIFIRINCLSERFSPLRPWCPCLDIGRKLNTHKTFRRRPGRLLNVLCSIYVLYPRGDLR